MWIGKSNICLFVPSALLTPRVRRAGAAISKSHAEWPRAVAGDWVSCVSVGDPSATSLTPGPGSRRASGFLLTTDRSDSAVQPGRMKPLAVLCSVSFTWKLVGLNPQILTTQMPLSWTDSFWLCLSSFQPTAGGRALSGVSRYSGFLSQG